MIELIHQDLSSVINESFIQSEKQIQKANYLKLEKEYDKFFEKEGYLYPEFKRKIKLNNGLQINVKRLWIKREYKCEYVLAFDTETYKGKCKLLACNKRKFLLNPTFYQCIKFLFSNANTSKIYRFFYNIDFDISAILKLWKSNINVLKKRILRKIEWLKNGIDVKYKCYILKWIKGRMFIIKHISRKKSVAFTDIFNFFLTGLNKSAVKYLNDVKINDINGNLLNTSIDYWNKREKDIIEYCIQDCILTEKLGKLLIKTIEKNNLPLPKYLVSSASLSKQYFRKNSYICNVNHTPEKILQLGYDCYFGGRFEILKRGFFDKVYLYDINSQYPNFIKDLPNLRDGLWQKTLFIPKEKCLGYFKVKFNIPKEYKIPTIPVFHKGVNKFPNGILKKWLTWFDIDLIRNYIVKVYDGYVYHSKDITYKPFEKQIEHLFKQKQKLKGKNELSYNITKLTMNALYGCFIEQHKDYDKKGNYDLKAGILFNSVYASQITAFGRWSVLKDIPKEKYNNIIAIHTDSIISDISLDKYLILNLEIGNWNKEKEGIGIILNTGMYQIDDLVKTRGIPKRFVDNWLTFCKENQIYKKKLFEIPHMRKLSEGLIRDKSLINVNTIMNDKKSINCNSDSKRDWISNFGSFKEVISRNIDSYPCYSYNILGKLKPNPLCIAYRFEHKNLNNF